MNGAGKTHGRGRLDRAWPSQSRWFASIRNELGRSAPTAFSFLRVWLRVIEHIARHGISPLEAEHVVRHAQAPWPEQKGDDKLRVWGANERGELLQVIFTLKRPDELDFDSLTAEQWADLDDDDEVIYVIHAIPIQ